MVRSHKRRGSGFLRKFTISVAGDEISFSSPVGGAEVLAVSEHESRRNIVAWRVNHYLRSLDWTIDDDAVVEFVDTSSFEGMEVYRRSLSFLLVLACKRVLNQDIFIRHSLSDGYYCELPSGFPSKEDVARVKRLMEQMVDMDLPFMRKLVSIDQAKRIFERQGNADKARLLQWAAIDPVEVYCCADTHGFFYAPLAPSTGYLRVFDLVPYGGGMVLLFPTVAYPDGLPPFQPPKKLAEVFREYTEWLDILNVGTMDNLHKLVAEGKAGDLILTSEALHSQRLSHIAKDIASRSRVRLVCMAGPSGSGKTTASLRLRVQLQALGKRAVTLALDDYFLERDRTPVDAEGNYDFEALEALDIELINDHLRRLLTGEAVRLPHFNFLTGKREWGELLQLGSNALLIIEGIHGLNERVSESISDDDKYRIYVSPLTALNLDRHNRTSTTDNRLLRRLVRDYRTRGKLPEVTLRQWPSVVRGAQKHIFPYQERADIMFNSALVYELSALKGYAEPLLSTIPEESPVYGEARRLISFLRFIPFFPSDQVPNDSILREFIGGSCFSA